MNHHKERQGIVMSDKMQKTIIVSVERRVKHPLYNKYIFKTKRYAVHDEENNAGIGDLVLISENRPLSKTKKWSLVSILKKAK